VLNLLLVVFAMADQSSNGRLQEAIENLLASQANLLANQASFQANLMALNVRTDERFARIEAELSDIRAILLRHEEILQSLPEAIRQKIGYETR
jgi:hypothetical protein